MRLPLLLGNKAGVRIDEAIAAPSRGIGRMLVQGTTTERPPLTDMQAGHTVHLASREKEAPVMWFALGVAVGAVLGGVTVGIVLAGVRQRDPDEEALDRRDQAGDDRPSHPAGAG